MVQSIFSLMISFNGLWIVSMHQSLCQWKVWRERRTGQVQISMVHHYWNSLACICHSVCRSWQHSLVVWKRTHQAFPCRRSSSVGNANKKDISVCYILWFVIISLTCWLVRNEWSLPCQYHDGTIAAGANSYSLAWQEHSLLTSHWYLHFSPCPHIWIKSTPVGAVHIISTKYCPISDA